MNTDRQDTTEINIFKSLIGIIRSGVFGSYNLLLRPRSTTEDNKRRERILTIALLFINIFLLVLESSAIMTKIEAGEGYIGINILLFTLFVVSFLWLYYICRIGYFKIASYLFIIIYFVLTLYGSMQFGVSMPAGLLSYVLVITMASIVISSRVGAVTAVASILSIVIVGLIEKSNGMIPDWRFMPIQINDLIQYSVFFILLAAVSWLSNTEMEHSLKRARLSERLLKEERDNLEILVDQRTQALREAEQERVTQLSRFAEFGKRSAGLFHDLLGPLGALALTIGNLRGDRQQTRADEAEYAVSNAIDATRRMQQFMDTIRRQLAEEETITSFSILHEIEEAIRLLHYQSQQSKVSIVVNSEDENVYLVGNTFKFMQIMANLLANAVESFDGIQDKQEVSIHIRYGDQNCFITVSDNGCGIPSDVLPHIFNTFYTTKPLGIGLGLATVKDTVEKVFNGTISCTSTVDMGTTFIVTIPHGSSESHTIDTRLPRL
jgi:signal transduction histidine kinase